MLSLEDAQERVLSFVAPLGKETVSLSLANGRILAEEIISSLDLPPFDNSAMDGYAVRAGDTARATPSSPVSLQLAGRVTAGDELATGVAPGKCVRLFTGSPLPKGSDAVVMQEDTCLDPATPGSVLVLDSVKPWENVRFSGEDVKQGARLTDIGERLTPGRCALLGAVGRAEVLVGRSPVLGVIATGNELREAGQHLSPGQIYESNRLLLAGLGSGAGATPRIYPLVGDTLAATESALCVALTECDAVVTTGGVSVGESDFVKAAFQQLGGALDFWKVSMKPGKPFTFGTWHGKLLFGLPGNPVSAFATFLLLVRPGLLKMQGAREVYLPRRPGALVEPLANRGDRRHFVRVVLTSNGEVRSAGTQASHMLSSLARANGLVDVPPNQCLEAGTRVSVLDCG